MTALIAPCHPYHPALGTGLEWRDGQAYLWLNANDRREAATSATSASAFFRYLDFLTAFPQVTHWFTRTHWTGRVWCSAPELVDDDTLDGVLLFNDDSALPLPWSINAETDDGGFDIAVPVPPGDAPHFANLLLRAQLARVILATAQGDTPAETWLDIDSAVPSAALAEMLPVGVPPITKPVTLLKRYHALKDRWFFEETPGRGLRELFVESAYEA